MKTFFAFFLAVILGIALGIGTAMLRMSQTPWAGNPPVTGDRVSAASAQPK
jgi:hypothetical protein